MFRQQVTQCFQSTATRIAVAVMALFVLVAGVGPKAYEIALVHASADAFLGEQVPGHLAFSVPVLREPIVALSKPDPDHIPRRQILRAIFDKLTRQIPATDHQTRVMRVAAWVQFYFAHPIHTPLRPNGTGAYDPLQLLELRRAQCGQVNRVLIDILDAADYRGRVVQLKAHQGAEVFYDGGWHYLEGDALTDGQQIMRPDGTLPSALEIHRTPQMLDGICISCEHDKLSEHLNAEIHNRYTSQRNRYLLGDAWKEIFSIAPSYYERLASPELRIGDPQYGWMNYQHISESAISASDVLPTCCR